MNKVVSILLLFIASSALAAEKCDYKVQFDDTIPAKCLLHKIRES